MKELFENFKNFLTEATLADYNDSGTMTLYHYGKNKSDTMILDPARFVSNTSRHSRKEFEVSDVPRVFFYADVNKTEEIIKRDYDRKLFKVEVSHSEVYDLKSDPEGFIQQVKDPMFGLRKRMEWNDLLNLIKENYNGAFYSIGEPDIVTWFKPIEVYEVNDVDIQIT
jgi:hypothetical protein